MIKVALAGALAALTLCAVAAAASTADVFTYRTVLSPAPRYRSRRLRPVREAPHLQGHEGRHHLLDRVEADLQEAQRACGRRTHPSRAHRRRRRRDPSPSAGRAGTGRAARRRSRRRSQGHAPGDGIRERPHGEELGGRDSRPGEADEAVPGQPAPAPPPPPSEPPPSPPPTTPTRLERLPDRRPPGATRRVPDVGPSTSPGLRLRAVTPPDRLGGDASPPHSTLVVVAPRGEAGVR